MPGSWVRRELFKHPSPARQTLEKEQLVLLQESRAKTDAKVLCIALVVNLNEVNRKGDSLVECYLLEIFDEVDSRG